MSDKRPWEDPWRTVESVAQIEQVWQTSQVEDRWRNWVAAIVAPLIGQGERILEVGCGSGLIYEALYKVLDARLHYTGVDNSVLMLQKARGAFPKVSFSSGDAFALRFGDRSFGTVLCISLLGHLPDCRPALSELLRVAKNRVVASFWLPTPERQGKDGDLFAEPHYYLHTQAGIERAAGDDWRVTWQEFPGIAHLALFERVAAGGRS